MAALSANALFSLTFNGIADDEALTLAKKIRLEGHAGGAAE